MAIPVVNVTVTVRDAGNNPVANAPVWARPIIQDQYQGQIVPREPVTGVTDVNGACVLALFPNVLGEITGDFCGNGSKQNGAYQIKVRDPVTGTVIYQTVAQVPNNAVSLTAIAGNFCATPTPALGASASVFADGEVPNGALDGVNRTFLLNFAPNPSGSLEFFLNGQQLNPVDDFTLAGNVITTNNPLQAGDKIRAWYRH